MCYITPQFIYRFSHAANAFENCDRKYRAVFAEPRRTKQSYEASYDKFSAYDQSYMKGPYPIPPPPDMPKNSDGYTKLQVIASPMLNQDQLWKLFDIIPGIKINGRNKTTTIIVTYTFLALYTLYV